MKPKLRSTIALSPYVMRQNDDQSLKALDSIAHVKSLLVMLMERLELKGKKFSSFPSASDQDIGSMWEECKQLIPSLKKMSHSQRRTRHQQELSAFMTHCCQSRHYTFQIRKRGSKSCTLCGPIRHPRETFEKLHFLPEPVPCSMWRLLYCRFKLYKKERSDLQKALQDILFTCSAQLQDLELPGRLNDMYTWKISIEQPIEKLYYSAKYSPISMINCIVLVERPSGLWPVECWRTI